MTENQDAFARTFTAAMAGGYIGHLLDQTRFGIWFNESRVIGMIYWLIGRAVILGVIVLAVWYMIIFFSMP